DQWRFWRRRPAPVWQSRVERSRSAIGRFSDEVQQRLGTEVPPKVLHDMLIALDELMTNVVMHAEQAAGPIDVELRYDARAVEARISYLAVEFDPTTWRAPAAATTVAGAPIGGLGIKLVRTLLDEFRYEYADGRNVLTLVRRR
ncbi:MAG: ATP-binding protein, partial [Rudaea sp.]